ncbi:MAG: carbon-nitrogen family hydrolase [Deltaproteobacteria bacterium]|nr:carbon-nitrogen family hydrolase [Deltaproteobacteria bacterium]
MNKKQLNITLVQMNVSLGCPDKNLARLKELLIPIVQASDIILLPELWSSGYDFSNLSKLAAATPSALAQLTLIAKTRKTCIGGSLIEKEKERFYNTFYCITPDGKQIAAYRKIHLFSMMDEDRYFSPGHQPSLIEICGLKVGLLTCYDIRFPELSRTLALQGAQLLLVCAQWPRPRTAHWRALLQARAIENQLFVAACNRIGQGENHLYPGNSVIIDPWGETILKAPQRQGAFSAAINLSRVAAVRRTMSCFKDRRPACYNQPESQNST